MKKIQKQWKELNLSSEESLKQIVSGDTTKLEQIFSFAKMVEEKEPPSSLIARASRSVCSCVQYLTESTTGTIDYEYLDLIVSLIATYARLLDENVNGPSKDETSQLLEKINTYSDLLD